MNLKLNKVIIENFLSIGHAEIELNNLGFVIVSGKNDNPLDNAQSNGSGKSAIFEAIMWVFTGNTVRGTKDVVNKYAPGGTYVGIDCTVDGNHYKILRSREHKDFKTNLKIVVNGEDKSGKGIRDGEEILHNLFPDLTVSLLGSTTILGQGLPQRLTNNTPSKRKEIIEEFANAEFMVEDLKERLSAVKSNNQVSLKDLEAKTTANLTETKFTKSQLEEQQRELSEINIEPLKAQLAQLKSKEKKLITELESLESQKASQDSIIKNFGEEYLNLDNSEKKEWQDAESQFPTESSISSKYPTSEQIESKFPKYMDIKSLHPSATDIDNEFAPELDAISDKIRETATQIAILEQDIKTKDSIVDVCPTCGQKIPNVVKFDTTGAKIKLKELGDLKDSLEKQQKEIRFKREQKKIEVEKLINKEYTAVTEQIQAKKSEIDKKRLAEIAQINEQKSALREDIRKKYSDKKELIMKKGQEIRAIINGFESQIKQKQTEKETVTSNIRLTELQMQTLIDKGKKCQENIVKFNQKLSQLAENLLYITNEKDNVNQRLATDAKMETLLRRDFKGMLISNLIEFIQTECHKFGEDIFHNQKVDFYLNGNDIFIGYNGKEYVNLSGGEKQKVDVIVQFALRSMLCQLTGFSTNILVLDEITDGLDSIGCQEVINCVTKNLTDVSSVFIISHRTDLNLPCDKQLIIRKNSLGVSRVSD